VYYPFKEIIENNNRRTINNALINNEGFYLVDFKDLEEKASEKNTSMMILCNPHNPVGRVWKEEELIKMAGICLENDVIIISDEIHCDLLRKESEFIPLGSIISDDRIISCTSASKSFNLAGMQIANIIIKKEEFRHLWDDDILGKQGLYGSNPFGIVATIAAYNQARSWLKHTNQYIDANLQYVMEFLNKYLPKAIYKIPEGTYFAWIDFRPYGLSAEKLETLIQKKAGVLLDEGYIFGKEGVGFERINVACPRSILKDCLERIQKVISDSV